MGLSLEQYVAENPVNREKVDAHKDRMLAEMRAYRLREVREAMGLTRTQLAERIGVTMAEANHYTYRVSFSPDDNEHVATVAELPSLSWLAATPQEALSGIMALVDDLVADLRAGDS